MSLDQLVGPTIQLVVYIKEGHGFGFLTSPVIVTASLLGHVLTTDVESPSADPHFDYELTYEINKKLIKRLRVDNTSLKIDCYAMNNGRKDRIGYILLNLKELQVVQGIQITEAWHRVLGLSKEARVLGPQLLLSFYITDIPKDDPNHNEMQPDFPIWKKSNESHPLTSYIKEDEGIVHIGPETKCKNNFTLTMSIVAARNITQLIVKDIEHDVEPGVSVIYTMLGYTVQTKAVSRINDSFLPNEKIVIRLRSTLKYLSELVEPLKVDLRLMFGNDEIGTTSFLLEDLTKNLKKIVEKRCFVISPNLDSTMTPELQPGLELAVCFARESKPMKKTIDLRTIESHKFRDEDGKKLNRPESQQITSIDQKGQTVSMPSVRLNLTSLNKTCPKTAPGGSTYRANKDVGPLHNYVLTVVLDSIQLSELPGEDGKVLFRFLHPEAEIKVLSSTEIIVNNVNETVTFPPVQADFSFKLPANIHQSSLMSHPPKIVVISEGKELATTPLHLGILFSHDQKKCSYTAVLEEETHNKGLLGVTMSLDDVADQVEIQSSVCEVPSSPLPCIDDQLMLKVVEELEDWKDKQQEIFKAELMRKEREYLAKVSADWEDKKHRMEEAVVFNVENSQTVLDSLNTATENLRMREHKLKEKELKLQHEKEELRRKYMAKTQELRIASQRMKEEHAHKTSMAIMEKVENLETKVKLLEKERESLEKVVQGFEEDNIKNTEGILNQEQAESILKEMENILERLTKEKQSKIFYKTEWGKSVREQRRIKKLYDEALKQQIERNNEELRLLTIQNIASGHDKALQEDQLRLLGLKSEVLAWNKGQGDSARSGGTEKAAGSMQSGSQFYGMIKDTDQRSLQPEETTSISESPRIDESMTVNTSSQQIKRLMMI